jgi:hypothetical protein
MPDSDNRRSNHFFLVDAGFTGDPKFVRLARRLPDPDDFNSAVGAFFIALALARRKGSPYVDLAEVDSRFMADLIAVGLLVDDGFRAEAFERWGPQPRRMDPDHQARAGRARAEKAIRTASGAYQPEPAGASRSQPEPADSAGDQPAVASRNGWSSHPAGPASRLVSSSMVNPYDDLERRNGGNRVVADAPGWAYIYPVVVEVTGRHASGGGRFAETLCELAQQAGPEKVMEAIRAVGVAMAPVKPDLRAVAFAVNDALRMPPSGRDLAQRIGAAVAEREAQAATRRKKAEEATRLQRAERLADEFIGGRT